MAPSDPSGAALQGAGARGRGLTPRTTPGRGRRHDCGVPPPPAPLPRRKADHPTELAVDQRVSWANGSCDAAVRWARREKAGAAGLTVDSRQHLHQVTGRRHGPHTSPQTRLTLRTCPVQRIGRRARPRSAANFATLCSRRCGRWRQHCAGQWADGLHSHRLGSGWGRGASMTRALARRQSLRCPAHQAARAWPWCGSPALHAVI